MSITFLLYQPENADNLGSIARAASNFDFHDIVLIDPKCRVSEKSRWLAKHGLPTLEKMRIADESILDEFDIVVATHGRNSTALNVVRAPISPRELSEKLIELDFENIKIGILFGPEGEGLTKDMLARSQIVCAIPTSRDNPSMNLAQSVTVFLYEMSMLTGRQNKITLPYRPLSREEHDALVAAIFSTIDNMSWKTDNSNETQKVVWRHFLGKAVLTKREGMVVMGYMKNVHNLTMKLQEKNEKIEKSGHLEVKKKL